LQHKLGTEVEEWRARVVLACSASFTNTGSTLRNDYPCRWDVECVW
jgi:hypothetical protein